MTLQAVLKEALALDPNERAKLADELWRSIPLDRRETDLTTAQADDLRMRVAEDASGKSSPRDWRAFRAELDRKK